MLKARLTTGLKLGPEPTDVFAAGDELVGDDHVPAELIEQLLAAGQAELVVQGATSTAMAAAIAAYHAAFGPVRAAIVAMVDEAERGGLAEARALFETLLTTGAPAGLVEQVDFRVSQLFAGVRRADEAGDDPDAQAEAFAAALAELRPEQETISPASSPSPAEDEAGGDAASEGAAEDGPAAPEHSSGPTGAAASEDGSSTLGTSEAGTAASSEGAGTANDPASDASTDAPQPNGGVDGATGAPAPVEAAAAPTPEPKKAAAPAARRRAKSG